MKNLCFITMVRENYEFLRVWIDHHRTMVSSLGDLIVVSHGPDPKIDEIAQGCSIIRLPEDDTPPAFEPSRREMFFGLVRAMLPYYRFVVIGDVDELIVLDPKVERSLGDYLADLDFKSNVLTVCNFNVMHDPSIEPASLDFKKPILGQRRHGSIAGGYCKPMIFRGAVGSSEGADSHRVPGEAFQLDRNIICFHLAYCDHGLTTRLSQEKLARFQELEEASEEGSQIGLWDRGDGIHRRRLRKMREAPACDWDGDEVRAYLNKLEHRAQKRGFVRVHFEWFDHVTLPERFEGIF